MQLTKSDALFLHSLLFHVLTSDDKLTTSTVSHINGMLSDLSDFLMEEPENRADEEEEDEEECEECGQPHDVGHHDDEDEDEEAEEVEAEDYLTPVFLTGLPAINVETPSGEKVSFEFEDVGDEENVDVLIDGGSVIIDAVTHVKMTSKSVEVYDGEQWHIFSLKRIPKTWKSLVESTTYGVSSEKGSDV